MMCECATCEEIQGEELGIENLPWYVWWKWTWKVKLMWRAWRHDRKAHYWEWKNKLRIGWIWELYYRIVYYGEE